MTHLEKIEAIRQECIRHNKEITELKFGCEVELSVDKWPKQIIIGRDQLDDEWRGDTINFGDNEITKIIGRKITLPDILLAMTERKSSYYLGSGGRFMLCHGFNWTNEQNEVECGLSLTDVYWNLLKPLEDQEEPTIDFIHSLLK